MNTHKLLARPANGARLQAAAPSADAETAAAPADTEAAAAPADTEAAAAPAADADAAAPAAGVGLDSMVPDSMKGFTPHLDKIHFPQK